MRSSKFIIMIVFAVFSAELFAQDKPDALLMYRQGEYQKAIDICLDELQNVPKNMDSYTVICWSYIKLNKFREAWDYAKKAMDISRYDHRIIEAAGEAAFYLGSNLEALKLFEEYAVLAPSGDRIDLVYYFMGEIYIRLQEYNNADAAFTAAVYYSPNTSRWWARLGYAREMAKNNVYALEAYEKALQLNPAYTEALRGKERVQASLN
jgi:tetratricopeptide (TPR) repeat protein